ncbi:MAG: GGDEF domain-containing protein [Methylotenera sp.]|nr:GGDEF domain-containing protein [Methylotenera sp.]
MIGILSILDPQENLENTTSVNGDLESLALEVVGHIGLAITNLRLRETLKNSAIVDVLTGLFNRRYLNETLARELARANRAKLSLGVIMLDIDHFKMFNDMHGHEAGDLVLKEVGLLLKNALRASDIACRYGGEEFVLVLPEADMEISKLRAETIRDNIRAINLVYGGLTLPSITVSIGICVFPDDGIEAETLLKAADDALYHAKRNGRDQIQVYLR